MKKFETETDLKYVKNQAMLFAVAVFIVLSLICWLCLRSFEKIFAAAEIVIILACLMMVFSKKQDRHNYRFRFEGSTLYVESKTGAEGLILRDMSASDFDIRQSAREKKMDYCTLLVSGSAMAFGGVKNCSGLREYIRQNCR